MIYSNYDIKHYDIKAQRYIQTNQQHKSFTTQVVYLNSCGLFLAVLVYMQEQRKCSLKTYIHIEIVSNGCSS